MNCSFPFADDPVSANQDNNRELRENRRRRSRFILPAPRHLAAVAAGALLAAVLVHYLGFIVLSWFDLGIHVHKASAVQEDRKPLPEKIVLKADDRPAPDVAEAVEKPDIEQLEEIPPELPDLEDMLPEQVVIAPGETSFSADPVSPSPPESLSPKMPQVDMNAVAKGLPEPSPPEKLKSSASPVTIKTAEPDMVNPDEWYNNKLKGAGGQDDSHLPDGSKSLSQLMAQSSLGKDSGYSRLGADLLFEYNKAVMKNSARLSMLQLAGLMMKNPDTIFIVEGHTDSFGSEEYNAVLSLMRANAVRQWLKDNGIALTRPNGECRLYIRACGASRPVVSIRGDRDAQAANRRVEIHMRKPGEEIPARSGGFPVHGDRLRLLRLQIGVKLFHADIHNLGSFLEQFRHGHGHPSRIMAARRAARALLSQTCTPSSSRIRRCSDAFWGSVSTPQMDATKAIRSPAADWALRIPSASPAAGLSLHP